MRNLRSNVKQKGSTKMQADLATNSRDIVDVWVCVQDVQIKVWEEGKVCSAKLEVGGRCTLSKSM